MCRWLYVGVCGVWVCVGVFFVFDGQTYFKFMPSLIMLIVYRPYYNRRYLNLTQNRHGVLSMGWKAYSL